ncbi:MAG: dockerin type I repeat-containing protein [Oscillospiraceae bacterium]|nr:dockerin type I repeat-containing protein [Oscillospiraceae bacterium]
MKKFVSTLTSLCMSVSLTAGTLAAFSTSAAVSDVPVSKTLKMLADGKASATISADEIAKGDVKLEIGVYLDESEATTGTITARIGTSDKDAVAVTAINDIFKETVPEYSYTFKGGANDGATVTTTSRLAFYGAYDADFEELSNYGEILNKNVFTDKGEGNFIYSVGANTPTWLGAKSDEFPVTTFEVTVKKGAAAGEYKVDFMNNQEDTGVAGQYRSSTQIGFADVTITTPLDNLLVGGLGEEGFTIVVEGDTPKTTAATTATTAGTTQGAQTTVTTNGGGSVDPLPDGLTWKVDDIKISREDLEASKTGMFRVPVKVVQTSDQTIAAAALSFKFPDELVWAGDKAKKTCDAYGKVAVAVNATLPILNFHCEVTGADGKAVGRLCEEEGAELLQICFKIDPNTPDGVYPIEMYLDPANNDRIVADNDNNDAAVNLLAGSITIGDVQDDTTASTTAATTAATTKTTTNAGGSTDSTGSGTVLYGDANVDGLVNIADVVCLNQYLVDNAKYNLKPQGKINAEVNLDGKLTAADSTSIIKSLVKLVTLPDKA